MPKLTLKTKLGPEGVVIKKFSMKKGLNQTQKAQVKRLVSAPAERKYVSEALRNLSGTSTLSTFGGFSSAITGVGEIYAAIPRIHQGIDEYQRIGNRVCPKSCVIKLDICTKVWNDNGSRDRTVHVFLLRSVSVKSLDNYTAIPITTLLQKGDGTNVSFDGTSFHAQYPVNTAEFKVLKHKSMRMVSGFGQSNSTTSATAGGTDGVISPSHQYAHVSLKVPLPKKMVYENNASTYPTNTAPFLCIGFTNNNSDVRSAPLDYVQVLGQTQLIYTDE